MSFVKDFFYSLRVVSEIVFPRHCAVCKKEIHNGCLCHACRQHYLLRKRIEFSPREEYLANQAEVRPEDVLDSVLWLYKYDTAFKDLLHQAKFTCDASVLPLLREEAEWALPDAKIRWLAQFDIVSFVPTSAERRAKRGFDVPEEIFGELLHERCVEVVPLLERVRRTQPLFEMQAEERRTELAGCFACVKNAHVAGKRVLLCDDIYTTGSTLAEAARVLREAGAREVHALTLTAARANWEVKE